MLQEGFHLGFSHDGYHADPCETPSLSASIAHLIISRSPLHAWQAHPRLGGIPKPPTREMERGSLLHRLVLDKGPQVAIFQAPDWRTKAARDFRDLARAEGEIPALEHEVLEAAQIAAKMRAQVPHILGKRLENTEVTLVWRDVEVLCRGRCDIWDEAERTIYDLKFVQDASPDAIGRHMVTYGADIQAAAYVRAMEVLSPELQGRIKFRFIFCEVDPPYAVTVAEPAGTMQALGIQKWQRAVAIWAECLAEDKWTGYGGYANAHVRIEAPPWALGQELEAAGEITY